MIDRYARRACTAGLLLGLLTAGCDSGSGTGGEKKNKPDGDASTATQPAQSPAAQPPTALFNGRDLEGWTAVLADESVKMDEVWSVADGMLDCKGRPAGYLRTVRDDFANYVLSVEWRWPAGTPGGNNGVLVHASTPGALGVWPKSIEVQMQTGEAGDFWIIGTELDVENEAARKEGRRHKNLTDGSEKPLGEWNQMEITCKGDEITVKVNGTLVNHATHCNVDRGAICLQSEGAPIQYRNIVLKPI